MNAPTDPHAVPSGLIATAGGAPTLALRVAVLSGQVPLEYASLVAGRRPDAARLLEDALWTPRTTEDA